MKLSCTINHRQRFNVVTNLVSNYHCHFLLLRAPYPSHLAAETPLLSLQFASRISALDFSDANRPD